MTQLSSAGVSAVHGYNSSHIEDITAGKFTLDIITVFISPEIARLMEWKIFTDPIY